MFIFFIFFVISSLAASFADNTYINESFFSQHCIKTVTTSHFRCPVYDFPVCTPWSCAKGPKSSRLLTCVVFDCAAFLVTDLGQKILQWNVSADATSNLVSPASRSLSPLDVGPTNRPLAPTTASSLSKSGSVTKAVLSPNITVTVAPKSTTSTAPRTVSTILPKLTPKPSFSQLTPPKMANETSFKDDAYCKEHFDCTEERKFSFTGCVTYYDNRDPGCHLYCQLERCGASYTPRSVECTFYHCAPKTTTTITTTTLSTTTTTAMASTTSPFVPNDHFRDPFFWVTVALVLVILGFLIFLVGRKCGRNKIKKEWGLFRKSKGPAFLPSPQEDTPLTAPDAWQSQSLQVPGNTYDDDEFGYFESKLVRPQPYRFPRVRSECERFSGMPHRIGLDDALYPHKDGLFVETPDQYKAVQDIKSLQQEVLRSKIYLDELRRSLNFLKLEQRGSSSERSQRIAPVRDKFESRIKLVTGELEEQKKKLEAAHSIFIQTVQGHSYQALTGRVPAAGERLIPVMAELHRSPDTEVDYDEIRSVGTEIITLP